MLPYILVVLFPFFVEVLYKNKVLSDGVQANSEAHERKIRWRYIFAAALPMFFLIAFRNQSIGSDTVGYLEHFEKMISTPWDELKTSSRMEYGYTIFTKLLTYITHNPLVFQIIYTSIYLVSLTVFVNELEEEHFFFLFLFGTLGLYTFMFTGVRQCIATCICMLSYRSIRNRKLLLFALLMLLAFQFHKSSILFAAAYLIHSRKLNFINVFAYTIATALIALNLEPLQNWLNTQLDYEYGIEGNTGGFVFSLIMMIITTFTIFAVMSNKSLNKYSQGLINIGIVATVFWIIRIFTRIAERPSFYFLPFSFAALGFALASLKDKKEKNVMKLLVFVFSLALYIYRFAVNLTNYLPYSFYMS